MAYTDIDKPSDYFNTVLYTGNGNSGHAISGLDFQPDFVWTKRRDSSSGHHVHNSISGATKYIFPNDDAAESTDANKLSSFNSDGFTVGTNGDANTDGGTFVAWNWKAGTSFTNDASATGIGTIDSTGSVNNDSGFSIVSFTGTGSNGTIKHGLSTAPNIFFIKRLDADNDWRVGSDGLTNWTKHINLNTTAAESDLASAFNSTAPTSSVFSVGTSASTNASGGTFIAYCFASIKGYSKIGGSYTGNGNADGTFVYTGFKPAFILAKDADSSDNWIIHDTTRNPSNPVGAYLRPNLSSAEGTFSHYDILSNGFKNLYAGGSLNGSGKNIIYMAFAENPFVTSTGVPTTAR